jgi:hypothetical protein
MIYKLFAQSVGAAGSASLDVREDDTIVGIFLDMSVAGVVDGTSGECELSFLSSSSFTTNDVVGALAGMKTDFELLTSGGINNARSGWFPCNVDVNAGERIHLHVTSTATITVRCYLYTDKKAPATSRAVRRR